MKTSTALKEHPILFSGQMVRAILEGRKTMTRRVVKGNFAPDQFIREQSGTGYGWHWPNWKGKETVWTMTGAVGIAKDAGFDVRVKCPYGKVGDRLYVRENISAWFHGNHWYDQAKEFRTKKECSNLFYQATHNFPPDDQRWVPSILMPRWASRITLEITDLRVERLQEITEEDARAEGVSSAMNEEGTGGYGDDKSLHLLPQYTYRWGFKSDWDCLGYSVGYGWYQNPWVWCISFRRID